LAARYIDLAANLRANYPDKHADDVESRARFLLEAEITGGLEYPGIVPVYGLGQYANGRPFYASGRPSGSGCIAFRAGTSRVRKRLGRQQRRSASSYSRCGPATEGCL